MGHGAFVSAMTPATDRKLGTVTRVERRRKRPQGKQQHQPDRNPTPHRNHPTQLNQPPALHSWEADLGSVDATDPARGYSPCSQRR
jgi:hypothetical protein